MSKSTLARESWVHTSLLARLMSCPLVIRLVIAMTLLPSVSCPEAMRTLAGLLVSVPFTRDWHVPTGKCIGEWRMLTPPEIRQEVFWHRPLGRRGPPGRRFPPTAGATPARQRRTLASPADNSLRQPFGLS